MQISCRKSFFDATDDTFKRLVYIREFFKILHKRNFEKSQYWSGDTIPCNAVQQRILPVANHHSNVQTQNTGYKQGHLNYLATHKAEKNIEDEEEFAECGVRVDVAKPNRRQHDENEVKVLPEVSHRVRVDVWVVRPRITITLQLCSENVIKMHAAIDKMKNKYRQPVN